MKYKKKVKAIIAVIILVSIAVGLIKITFINNEYCRLKNNDVLVSSQYDYNDSSNPKFITKKSSAQLLEDTSSTISTTDKTIQHYDTIYDLPNGDMSFFTYMDYRRITDKSSRQWELQQECWTDSKGLRRYNSDYLIALGSYFSTNIGDRFLITLDNGFEFTAVLGDCRADYYMDASNKYVEMTCGKKNIIEFIVDIYALDENVSLSGNIGSYSNYSGNIVSIQKINN